MPIECASGFRSRSVLRLLAWALLACGWTGASAESGAYRIEVLVFRHEAGAMRSAPIQRASAFPGAWQLDAQRHVIIPEDPVALEVMSDRMRGIWRHLENSGEYAPLLFRVWEQSRIDYQPPVRLHDDELLLEHTVQPPESALADLGAGEPAAPYRHRFYRLDGTVQLRRTRFLHLDLDIQYRLQIQHRSGLAPGPSSGPFPDDAAEGARTPPGTDLQPLASIYRLRESRQVRPGDLLYFDTPYLGVLARVTETAGH